MKIIDNMKIKKIVEPKYKKNYPFRNGKAEFIILNKDKNGCYLNSSITGYINEDGTEIFVK